MRVVFMGTPEFAATILESLTEKYDVVLVVTQPDKAVGRKQILVPSEVKKCAELKGIPVFQPKKIKEEYEPVLAAKPDIIITAAFGQFIPKIILDYPKFGCINVHGSLLPKYRGGAPIQKAIINGESETGITIMYMAPKMDAGDIILQRSIPILPTDDNGSMFIKLSILGKELLHEALPLIIAGTNKKIAQDESLATYAYNISHEEQFIDWNNSAQDVFNHIRGLSPNPTALSSINGTIIKVYEAKVVETNLVGKPGEVLSLSKELLVACGKDAISILTLQVSGKNKMDVKSFLNGQKIVNVGSVLENNIL